MDQAIPATPPPELMQAMQRMRAGDNRGALEHAQRGLAGDGDRAPYLALASLAALRLNDPAQAEPLLRELVDLNPADHASAANLANALIQLERFDDAMAIVKDARHPSLVRIRGFLLQRLPDLEGAADCYRIALEGDPNDLSSWNNLGNVLVELGQFDLAIGAYERAITLAPVDLRIYYNLAETLGKAERHNARLRVLQDAIAIDPVNYETLVQLGLTLSHLEDTDGAIATLRKAIAIQAGFGEAHIELGIIYESLNRVEELAALADSVDAATAPPEAAFLFAWRAQRSGDFERANELAQSFPETIHPMRRFHLIGSIADRVGDADGAIAAFKQMNREALSLAPPLQGSTYRQDVMADLAKWTTDWADGWSGSAPDDGQRDPVFLVGFPRSGTTLLDTMLMGQPELSVLEERPMMARAIGALREGEDLPALSDERLGELRATYFQSAQEAGWDGNRWLVDKHPLNMERVPAIHRLFPNARIILAERHPYDVVLSCFMANFNLNHAMRSFSSLDEAARTYDAVFEAWERGTSLFPTDWRPVRYERLVENPETELRPVIDWLGLEWSERIVDHTHTARIRGRVKTASYSQIGEQLYTRARYRWRNYAAHLTPVIPILRPWAEKMGYETE